MTKKKNSFFTFCFSLLPGAAHMYMGFIKQGLSIMTAFFAILYFASWFNIGILGLFAPIIWFYAFFDAHNKRSMDDEEFYSLEDDYIVSADNLGDFQKLFAGKGRIIIAVCLILVGSRMLWSMAYSFLGRLFPQFMFSFLNQIMHTLPQLVIAVLIIALGIRLIKGKKIELEKEEQFYQEYPVIESDDKKEE